MQPPLRLLQFLPYPQFFLARFCLSSWVSGEILSGLRQSWIGVVLDPNTRKFLQAFSKDLDSCKMLDRVGEKVPMSYKILSGHSEHACQVVKPRFKFILLQRTVVVIVVSHVRSKKRECGWVYTNGVLFLLPWAVPLALWSMGLVCHCLLNSRCQTFVTIPGPFRVSPTSVGFWLSALVLYFSLLLIFHARYKHNRTKLSIFYHFLAYEQLKHQNWIY